jgi:hypothetical protein
MGIEPFRKDSNEILRQELSDFSDEKKESIQNDVEKIKTAIVQCRKIYYYDDSDDYDPPDYTPALKLADITDPEAWGYFVENYDKDGVSSDIYSEWNDCLEEIFTILPNEIITNPTIAKIFFNHPNFKTYRLFFNIKDRQENKDNFEILSHTTEIKEKVKKDLFNDLVNTRDHVQMSVYGYFLNTREIVETIKDAVRAKPKFSIQKIKHLITQINLDPTILRTDPDLQKYITDYIKSLLYKNRIENVLWTTEPDYQEEIFNIFLLDIVDIHTPGIEALLDDIIENVLKTGDTTQIDNAKKITGLTEKQKKRINLICAMANVLRFSKNEYSILQSCPDEELQILSENNTNKPSTQAIIQKLRRGARDLYNTPRHLENNGFIAIEQFGLDEEITWNFLGANQNRHDTLQNVPNFIRSIPDKQEDRKIATAMFRAAGMGTGMQRKTMIEIMGHMTTWLWIQLKTTSTYPDRQPPLADAGNVNLLRIKNEIRLYQMPELLESIRQLPSESPLRAYTLALLEHPSIDVNAIINFVNNPEQFFASRTGAGEEAGGITKQLLTQLDPTNAPGTWNAVEARDAIINGTFDTLNSFQPQQATWIKIPEHRLVKREAISTIRTFSELQTQLDNADEKKSIESVLSDLRIQLFLDHISSTAAQNEAALSASLSHIEKKGGDIIEKSILYYQKTKKLTVEELQKMHAHIEKIKLDALQTKNPVLFWREIAMTGWLNSMPLHGLDRRMFGTSTTNEHTSESELLDQVATTETGTNTFKKTRREILHLFDSKTEKKEYSIEILAPSDPQTATAGSTTGNCDAFGHGKKAHFMINPGTAQLILKEGGKVIAQSTITMGRKLWKQGAERTRFFETLRQNQGKLGKALTANGTHISTANLQNNLEQFALGTPTITLDSVEVPPNTQSTYTPKDIYGLLQTGIHHLGSKNTTIHQADIRIGTSYSYLNANSGLPMGETQDITITPLAYTDNTGEQNIVLQKVPDTATPDKERDGVRPAKPTDTTTIALMEEIAFRRSGGESYITGLISMTKELWASTVSTAHRRQKPLSFISHNERGIPNGYLIAYEQDQNTIYITDTATTGTEKGVGGQLLMSLLQSCADDPTHRQKKITMDCRGVTSALAIATKKSAIETLQFQTEDGNTVSFQVNGPELDEIFSDTLYQFTFVPQIDTLHT